jgi:hypothetical protein
MAYRGGFSYSGQVVVGNTMSDPGPELSLKDQFREGVGKAHRQVVFAHHDYRNFSRGSELPKGIVSDT